MYKSQNPSNKYIANTSEIRQQMVEDGIITFGDVVYDVEAQKEVILGEDNQFEDYVEPTGGGGGSITLQDKQVSYTSNGTNTVTADSGCDGLSSVEVDVDVQPNLQSKSVSYTTNGQKTITPTSGYDGMSDVSVSINVQPRLQEQSLSYTENGSYAVEPESGFDGLSKVWLDINISGGGDVLVEKTYAELVGLKSQNQLVPGTFYRITDFVTKINGTYHEDGSSRYIHYARSVEHPFDVIVSAISENTLSEDAAAIQHSGDTYFANNNLAAWEIKYTIENDASRFLWADETSGKGVIYYMKDEFNNEAWYDFKNVQFVMYGLSSDIEAIDRSGNYSYGTAAYLFASLGGSDRAYFPNNWDDHNISYYGDRDSIMYYEEINQEFIENYKIQYAYTFNCVSGENQVTDASLNNSDTYGYKCINNSIGRAKGFKYLFIDDIPNDSSYMLNMCVFRSVATKTNNNKIGDDCLGIVLNNGCSYNVIGDDCTNCLILTNGHYNKIGNSCYNIFICNDNDENIIGNRCQSILIDSNTNGYSKSMNTFGDDSTGYLGKYCTGNSIGNNSSVYLYGNFCQDNIISDNVQAQVYSEGDGTGYWFFQGNKFYGNAYVSCGTYCNNNTFYSMSVDLGNNCSNNTFVGPNENDVRLEDSCCDNYIGAYCEGITFYEGCCNNFINNYASSFSLPSNSRNCNVLSGYYSYAEIQEDLSSNETKFIGIDSNDNVKIWNPADLVQ